MSGGKQCVVWDGTVSSLIDVLYGVHQGSILGPILLIILTSGMAKFLGVKEEENIVYADDSNVWRTGSNGEEVVRKLAEKAALFVEYTRRMGLSMNAAKTQLLLSSHAGNMSETTVEVDGNTIHPGDVIELLGVRYDRKLSTTPHIKLVLARSGEATGFSHPPTCQPPAKGGVPAAVVLRVGHGQVLPRAGGCGKAEAGARGQRVRRLEQDPGGIQ
jgi:hypothetical protein